jgi:hypothetical protein
MCSCLLKRVLPFTLTFIVGATLGWLFNFQGSGARFAEMTTRLENRAAPFGYGYGHSCRMHARNLVAETRPLIILFKPDAHWPRSVLLHYKPVTEVLRAHVTFGADGKVQQVEPCDNNNLWLTYRQEGGRQEEDVTNVRGDVLIWAAVEQAARQIQFEPEMVDGLPVSVTKDVEIHFMAD